MIGSFQEKDAEMVEVGQLKLGVLAKWGGTWALLPHVSSGSRFQLRITG